MLLNEDLNEAARRGQPAALLRELRAAYLQLLLQGEVHIQRQAARTPGAAGGGHEAPKDDPAQQA